MPSGNNLYHIETSQLSCSVNQVTGFRMVQVITEKEVSIRLRSLNYISRY